MSGATAIRDNYGTLSSGSLRTAGVLIELPAGNNRLRHKQAPEVLQNNVETLLHPAALGNRARGWFAARNSFTVKTGAGRSLPER
jgi:hypothetical protein